LNVAARIRAVATDLGGGAWLLSPYTGSLDDDDDDDDDNDNSFKVYSRARADTGSLDEDDDDNGNNFKVYSGAKADSSEITF
jgi:hypothetical protein